MTKTPSSKPSRHIENAYPAFFHLSPNILCITDVDGLILDANQQWETSLGYQQSDIIGRYIHTFAHPEDAENLQQVLSDTITAPLFNIPSRYKTKSGRYLWFEWNITYDSETQLINAIGHNVTQLTHTSSYLKTLSEITNMGLWEIDLVTQELYWSEEIHKIHETDPDTYKPKLEEGINFYHPDSLPIIQNAVNQQIAHGENYDLELQIITAKKNIRWVRAISHSEMKNNKPIRLYGAFKDITEKKHHMLEQEVLRQRIQLAHQASHVGVWDFDLITNELIWDDQMYRHYDIQKEDFSGAYEAWQSSLHPDDAEKVDRLFNDAAQGKKPFDCTFRIITPKKEIRYIDAIATLIKDEKGTAIRMIGVNTNITKSETSKNELEKQKTLAEQSNRAKSFFIANMSHEFRTPLNSVIGFSQRLIKKGNDVFDEKHLKAIKNIHENGLMLLSLINNLLDLSQIDTDSLSLEKRKTNISETLESSQKEFIFNAEKKSLSLTSDIQKDCYAEIDILRFQQILSYLLDNAIKYTEQGSITLSIYKEALDIKIKIKDTGIGISDKRKEKLFQRFENIENEDHTQIGKGSGLGLAITYELVNLHNGTIEVESVKHSGSCFTITLPAC